MAGILIAFAPQNKNKKTFELFLQGSTASEDLDAAVASPVTDLLGNVVENVLDNLEIVSVF